MSSSHTTVDLNCEEAVSLRKKMVKAIAEFQLIEEGDHLMVCTSGGKDSSVMLALLTEIQRRAPYRFTLEAVLLDQKQPGFSAEKFRNWVERDVGVKLTIVERDTYSIVVEKVKDGTYCSLCSRLRRAILYDVAHERGATKMVLGHHREDANHTLLLNLFYTGKIAGMPAKLKSDNGRNILIRPLMYCAEADIAALANKWQIPIIPCNLCGSQSGLKRNRMKQLVAELSREIPHIRESMLTAQANVKPSQLLDAKLYPFAELEVDASVDAFTGLTAEARSQLS